MSRVDANRAIRSARPEDAPGMLRIYAPIVSDTAISFEFEPPSESEMAGRIQRVTATNPWLVLEKDGTIVGYAYATEYRSRPAYAATRETTVYVHPEHRRSGAGRQLMTTLLTEVARRGAVTAVAVIGLPNDASVALHRSLGFVHAGTIHRVARKFERWHDEGYWVLTLPRPL